MPRWDAKFSVYFGTPRARANLSFLQDADVFPQQDQLGSWIHDLTLLHESNEARVWRGRSERFSCVEIVSTEHPASCACRRDPKLT